MDLQNTQVAHFPLTLADPNTGAAIAVPAGDVFTATSSSPSLGVAISTDADGNQQLDVTPLVVQSDSQNGGGNITVQVTDSNGDAAGELTGADAINIVTVPVVPQIRLGAVTFTQQAAPTNPGP
jgi:hypothetical protein